MKSDYYNNDNLKDENRISNATTIITGQSSHGNNDDQFSCVFSVNNSPQ